MRRSLRALLLAATTLLLGASTAMLSPAPASASVYRLCSGFTDCSSKGYSSSGYDQNMWTMYWRMYPGNNCTNYVAYRMVRSGMPNVRPWSGSGSGNATYWGDYMKDVTDQTPTVGAVAWWRSNVYPAGSVGHLAYVEKVISPTEIIISQDFWGGTFSWARVTKGGSGWPSGFIHFNDKRLSNVSRPEVGGTAKVGSRLTASAGTWNQPSPAATYQWMADGQSLQGATSSTLTLTDDLVDKRIRVKVTVRKDGYASASALSDRTGRVLPGSLATTSEPSLSGTAQVGETLIGDAGRWRPTPDETRYRWLVDGAPVPGALTSSYTLAPADAGKEIALKVVAVRSGYKKVVSTTPAQQVRPGVLVPSGIPQVEGGEMKPGTTLTTTLPTVEPTADRTVQWLRDGEPIEGAVSRSYTLTDADLGHRVRAQVQWTKEGYTTVTSLSEIPVRVRATTMITAQLDQVGPKGRAVQVSVQVTAPAVEEIGSVIAVRDEDGRLLAERPLRRDGSVTMRLADQAAGRHTYWIVSRTSPETFRVALYKKIALR